MDKIRVTTDVLKGYARQMEECADALASAKSDLVNIINNLPECCSEIGAQARLEKWVRAAETSGSDCTRTGQSLNSAAQGYEACEAEIQRSIAAISEAHEHGSGTVTQTATAGTVSHKQSGQTTTTDTTTDDRNIFEKAKDWIADKTDDVLDWMNINEYGRDYEDPGREREEARDQQMREEIEEIFREESLNEEAWNNADNEGKRGIINQVLRKLNRIYGTDVFPNAIFYSLGWFNQMGTYDRFTNTVLINETDYVHGYETVMNTIVHEMRHAYQRAASKDPESYEVSQETAQSWGDNWKEYKSEMKGYTREEYLDQPVEVDAREFAGSIDYGTSDD